MGRVELIRCRACGNRWQKVAGLTTCPGCGASLRVQSPDHWFTLPAVVFSVTTFVGCAYAIGVVILAIRASNEGRHIDTADDLAALTVGIGGAAISSFLAGASWRLRRRA